MKNKSHGIVSIVHAGLAYAVLTAAMVCCAVVAAAQSKLRLQHFSVNDGLPQNSVNYITQDNYGFIWMATGDGLSRYDGKDFRSFKERFNPAAPDRVMGSNVNSKLLDDGHNNWWLGSDAGVSIFDRRHDRFKVVVDRNSLGSATMLQALGDKIWLAVSRNGITSINWRTMHRTFYPFTDAVQADVLKSSPVNSNVVIGDTIYLNDAAGILAFDTRSGAYTRMAMLNAPYAATAISKDSLLIASENSVYLFNVHTRTFRTLPVKIPGTSVAVWKACFADTLTGDVYMGAITGEICRLNTATGQYDIFRFQNSRINHFFIDRSRNLWIGTEGDGAYKIDLKPTKFNGYSPESDGVSNTLMVKSVFRDVRGRIWLGTVDKGLQIYDPATDKLHDVALNVPMIDNQVSAVAKDSSGLLMVTVSNKVFWIDEQTEQVKARLELPIIAFSSPDRPVIFAITEWRKGRYLVATNIGLFSATRQQGHTTSKFPFSITNRFWGGWTYGLANNNDGTIYVGRRSGFGLIRVLDDTTLQVLDHGLEYQVIRHFYHSTTHPLVWMASEQGLLAYNTQTHKITAIDERQGLKNSNIYGILSENDSSLWVSTNRGLAHVKVSYNTLQTRITCYTAREGLQSDEFNTGAFYKAPDGTLYFGGINGVNWFHPRDIQANPYEPRPALTSIYVNDTLFANDTVSFISALTLPYNRNTISFSVRSLEFTSPEDNMIAYRLDGLEKDWVYTTSDRIRYSNLEPATYTLLVKARNNEGAWSSDPLTMTITILPPFWQTWWFRIMVITLTVMIIFLIGRYYLVQKVRERTLQLEKQQALNIERLRISKDVHDDLGAGLSKIALMAQLAQKQAIGDMALGSDIRQISAVSQDLIDNMHDLIWVLNPENTTLDNLVARIREYTADYLDGTKIHALLHFPEHVPAFHISREAQRNVFSAVKEAISNCIRHAEAETIEVGVSVNDDLLSINVKDNGKGICEEVKRRGGNGLRNMKQRIEAIGGTLTVRSQNKGTSVQMTIPLIAIAGDDRNTTFV